jgi:hypothetical protein
MPAKTANAISIVAIATLILLFTTKSAKRFIDVTLDGLLEVFDWVENSLKDYIKMTTSK